MSELKPCPFCGGEMKTAVITFEEEFYEPPFESWYLKHIDLDAAADKRCPIPTTDTFYETEAEAIAAWNTRHHFGLTDEDYNILLDEMGVSERTCKRITLGLEREREVATVSWICSACGKHINKDHDYCHNCGAKVVSG